MQNKTKGLLLLIVISFFSISANAQYYDSSFRCNENDYIGNSEERQRQITEALNEINLHWIDAYFFIILGPVAIFFASIVIFTFIKYPKMKEQPGDLFLMIALAEIILSIHWMVSSGNFLRNPDNPPATDGKFCLTNAVFSMIAGALEFLYNLGFCLYLYMRIRSVLKEKTMPKWIFHILCLGFSIIMVSIISGIGSLGKNLFGTCSIKAVSSLPFAGPIILGIYIFAALFSSIYFKRHVPQDPKFDQIRNQFLRYYYMYIKACVIIWSVQVICNILAIVNCWYIHSDYLGIVLTIGNISKLATPVVLSIIRMHDPFLKPKIDRLFRKAKSRVLLKKSSSTNQKNVKLSLEQPQPNEGNDLKSPFLLEPPQDDHLNQSGSSLTESQDVGGLLDVITGNMKLMLIYSMLSGMLLNNSMNYNRDDTRKESKTGEKTPAEPSKPGREFSPKAFLSEKSFDLSHERIERNFPQLAKEISDKEFRAEKLKMTVYSPEVFQELIEQDKPMVDLESSLNLTLNAEQVKKASGADGGKSGEFFFFSYDSRVIIKTLNETELKVMRNFLMDYYKYLQKNPDSMIAKIYGLYTFEKQAKESKAEHVMIIRNVSGYPRFCVERVFDMKGSTVAREVFKGKDPSPEELRKNTLKDMDFLRFENNIKIPNEYKERLAEAIARDSRFFRDHGIMDYSLILMKINRNAMERKKTETYGNLPPDIVYTDYFKNPLHSIMSIEEPGVYYHIGIIDYLQLWDIKKKLEKNTKILFKFDKNLDVSAQEPTKYSERFIDFIRKIILDR